jgi:nitrate reductase NapD
MKQNDSHISSFIVYCRAEKHAVIEQSLKTMPHLEIHGADGKGKFVLVTEAPHQGVILDRIEQITALEGVVDVSMVYHQVMPHGELADEVNDEGAAQLITSKEHVQFCETDVQSNASQH